MSIKERILCNLPFHINNIQQLEELKNKLPLDSNASRTKKNQKTNQKQDASTSYISQHSTSSKQSHCSDSRNNSHTSSNHCSKIKNFHLKKKKEIPSIEYRFNNLPLLVR